MIPVHTVFVTAATTPATFGGLAEADALCQAAADVAGLAGTFRALLSATGTDARDRVAVQGAIANTVGEVVALDGPDLWDSTLVAAVGHDEAGQGVSSDAWTGSNAAGTAHSNDCTDWTSTDGKGQRGQVDSVFGSWFSSGFRFCSDEARLYCLSE